MPVYPGMIPEESRPLREFIRRYHSRFNQLRFDVRLGAGDTVPEALDPAVKKAWEYITRMRVDAVGWRAANEATLIEVKQALGNEGVWQLLAYRDEYVRTYPTHHVRLVLVAEAATVTARALAQRSGVGVFLYEFPPNTVDISAPAVTEVTDGV